MEDEYEEGCDYCIGGDVYEGSDIDITNADGDAWREISTRLGIGDARGVLYASIEGRELRIQIPIYEDDGSGLDLRWAIRHCPFCGHELDG